MKVSQFRKLKLMKQQPQNSGQISCYKPTVSKAKGSAAKFAVAQYIEKLNQSGTNEEGCCSLPCPQLAWPVHQKGAPEKGIAGWLTLHSAHFLLK